MVYGPYQTLAPGAYAVEFRVMPHELGVDADACCIVDVLRAGVGIVAEQDFTASELVRRDGVIRVRFEVLLPDSYEYRVTATGRSGLTVRYRRALTRLDAAA